MADPNRLITIKFEGNCSCLKTEQVECWRMDKFRKIFQQYAIGSCFLLKYLKFHWNSRKLNLGESPESVGMPNMSTIKVFHDSDVTFGDVELAVLLNKGAKGKAEISSATSESGTKYVDLDRLKL